MSGRHLSPILLRTEEVQKLEGNDRHKVHAMLDHLRWLKLAFAEHPFDPKKRSFAAIHWALERLNLIALYVPAEVYSVWEGGLDGHFVLNDVHYTGSSSLPRWEGTEAEARAYRQQLLQDCNHTKKYAVCVVAMKFEKVAAE